MTNKRYYHSIVWLAALLLANWGSSAPAWAQSKTAPQQKPIASSTDRPKTSNANKRADQDSRADLAAVNQQIVKLTNEFRVEQDLRATTVDKELTATAEYFADFMAKNEKYGHKADGHTPAERVTDHDYEYCIISENIAYEFRSEGFKTDDLSRTFFVDWRDSPEHRKNMVDPDITETGVAVARSDRGYYYAVQLFGRPHSSAIDFSVKNPTDLEVNYQIEDQSFKLPPRQMMTHQSCRPPKVEFRAGEKESSEIVQVLHPAHGDHFVIRRADKNYAVDKTETKSEPKTESKAETKKDSPRPHKA